MRHHRTQALQPGERDVRHIRALRGLCPSCGHPPHDDLQAAALKDYAKQWKRFKVLDATWRLNHDAETESSKYARSKKGRPNPPCPPDMFDVTEIKRCPECGLDYVVRATYATKDSPVNVPGLDDQPVEMTQPCGRVARMASWRDSRNCMACREEAKADRMERKAAELREGAKEWRVKQATRIQRMK